MGTCTFCLEAHAEDESEDYWELGLPFLEQYYVIHEYENLRMGFVPFENSAKSLPVAVTETLSASIDTSIIGTGCNTVAGMPVWGFTLMIVAIAGVVGVGIWAAVVFCPLLKGSRKKFVQSSGQQESLKSDDVLDMLV